MKEREMAGNFGTIRRALRRRRASTNSEDRLAVTRIFHNSPLILELPLLLTAYGFSTDSGGGSDIFPVPLSYDIITVRRQGLRYPLVKVMNT
jgi:hypothetical protein